MQSFQTFERDDSELGPSTVISVRAVRKAGVVMFVMVAAGSLVLASLSPVFGYKADRVGPSVTRLLEVPVLFLAFAAYFALFELPRASHRLLAEPTELSIGRTGFRLGYLRHSRVYRWIDVVGISLGASHPTTPFTWASSSILVELAGQPDKGEERHRVFIPADKPWPQRSVLLDMLEEGRVGKVPGLRQSPNERADQPPS